MMVVIAATLLAAPAQAAAPAWRITGVTGPTNLPPGGEGWVVAFPTNIGGAATAGPISLTVGPLPPGVTTSGDVVSPGWNCPATGAGQSSITCTRNDSIAATLQARAVRVPVQVDAGAAGGWVRVSVQGGGAAPHPNGLDTYDVPVRVSAAKTPPGIAAFWAGAYDEDGLPYTQAGGHPHSAQTVFVINSNLSSHGKVIPAGDPRDFVADLPPGFVVNPAVTPKCPPTGPACAGNPQARIGAGQPMVQGFPPVIEENIFFQFVTNDTPPPGEAAQFSFPVMGVPAFVVGRVRTSSDFGARAVGPNLLHAYRLWGNYLVLNGEPAGAAGKALLTNPTDCSGAPVPTSAMMSVWQSPFAFSDPVVDDSPAVTGCDLVPFDPSTELTPSSTLPDSASGLEFDLHVPQDGLIDPDRLATSHVKKVTVELPEGMSVNPSGATGLEGCSDAQVALGTDKEPSCPDASKIGVASVTSPLLDQSLAGEMYLGTPKSTDPMSGQMLRLFLVVRNERYGLLVKLPGSATADPTTGRLTATFDNNPRLPFDDLEVKMRGGSRGLLATPQSCGSAPTSTTLSPWSGNADVVRSTPFSIAGDCSVGFAPTLAAGMNDRGGRDSGVFSFRFARPQGDQALSGLTARLPKGLLASIRDVPLCSDGQAAAGACPIGSRIGVVDAKAGSGDPFVLERKGDVFLTESYKGGEYGLAVKVRGIAGPFRGAMELSPIIVRQAIHVDRKTAQVTAISDPFPTIHHGVPLRVREVLVNVDRPNFMLNPSDCSPKQLQATILSAEGTRADVANHFQASGCKALPYKPRIGLALKGRRQAKTGGHPAVRARVRQHGVGEAGIKKAVVRLPKSLALDVNNAQALCEFEDGTKPDIEDHCPKGSIVGRARAITPLLSDPLVGNVYFVKNIRIDEDTGNEIRTLPMLVVALRGEIAVNLTGESSVDRRNRLVNTFDDVPDAPISKFNMNIRGGRNGILTVTRTRRSEINLCRAGRQVAEADTDGHNGKRHDFNIVMRKPCPKGRPAPAKVCRKRTNNKRALRRCVVKVKRNRAQTRRKIAKRKAAKRRAQRG